MQTIDTSWLILIAVALVGLVLLIGLYKVTRKIISLVIGLLLLLCLIGAIAAMFTLGG